MLCKCRILKMSIDVGWNLMFKVGRCVLLVWSLMYVENVEVSLG